MTRWQLSGQLLEKQITIRTQRDEAWTKALSHADAADMYASRAARYEHDLNALYQAQGLLSGRT